LLEAFGERFPERTINVGVAEQNMIGIATGLALSGKRVVAYSIVNFATLRCLEQIRNDVCYHAASVKIVGVGGGYAYGPQGYTHHGLEDLAVMRALPNIDVIAPADPVEVRLVTEHMLGTPGPAYLRLGKTGESTLHDARIAVSPGRIIRCRDGEDALIVTTGGLLQEALGAADLAARDGISVAVWSSPWLRPFDAKSVSEAAAGFSTIVTAEEGVTRGGLGSAVAEILAGLPGRTARLVIAGADDIPGTAATSQALARQRSRLDAAGLAARVVSAQSQQ
jgi:transketolase